MNLIFEQPRALWFFALVIPLIIYDAASFLRGRGGMSSALARRLAASAVLFGFFLIFFVIAMASPRWGNSRADGLSLQRRNLDLVMAIDVSGSMDLRDVSDKTRGELSRLERGLSLAYETAAALPGLRYAAVSGRGRGVLAVPLTWDNNAVLNFLAALDGTSLTGRSTNLESLLNTAAAAFQDTSPARRIILLISDGETLAGSMRTAAGRLSQNNISVISLAVGSNEGRSVAGLPDTISRRDVKAMRETAEKTGGIYIDGNGDDAADLLARYLRASAPVSGNGGEKKPRWFLFLAAAIICYGLSKISMVKK